jgi:hypothetical protein
MTQGEKLVAIGEDKLKNWGQVFYAYIISMNVDEEIGRSGIWGG